MAEATSNNFSLPSNKVEGNEQLSSNKVAKKKVSQPIYIVFSARLNPRW